MNATMRREMDAQVAFVLDHALNDDERQHLIEAIETYAGTVRDVATGEAIPLAEAEAQARVNFMVGARA